MRLTDLYTGGLSLRELAVYVREMPPGSAVAHADDTSDAWTVGEHLLAAAIDALNVANWQRVGDPDRPPPEPMRRPGVKSREEIAAERFNENLARWEARQPRIDDDGEVSDA